MKNHVYHKVSEKQAVFHGIVCRTWAASAGPNSKRLLPQMSLWRDNEQQYVSPSGHLNKEKSLFYLLVMTFSLQENWLAQAQSHQRTSCHRPTFALSAHGHVASSRWPIGKGTPDKQALREYHLLSWLPQSRLIHARANLLRLSCIEAFPYTRRCTDG